MLHLSARAATKAKEPSAGESSARSLPRTKPGSAHTLFLLLLCDFFSPGCVTPSRVINLFVFFASLEAQCK